MEIIKKIPDMDHVRNERFHNKTAQFGRQVYSIQSSITARITYVVNVAVNVFSSLDSQKCIF